MAVLRRFRGMLGLPVALRRFAKDTSAVTAVEFALILFPFLGLLGATIDVALLYFRSAQLQFVAESFARQVLVNGVDRYQGSTSSLATYEEIRNQFVCTWQTPGSGGVVKPGTLGKMFDCSKVRILVDAPAAWQTVDMSTNAREEDVRPTNRFIVPNENSVGVVRIFYPVNNYFRFIGRSASPLAGTFGTTNVVMGIAAFTVEPGGT